MQKSPWPVRVGRIGVAHLESYLNTIRLALDLVGKISLLSVVDATFYNW